MAKARKEFDQSLLYPDGYILRIRAWEVPPSQHRFKYSLFHGRAGERVILYGNERGNGDHLHYGDREQDYAFKDVEKLITDFLADVRQPRGTDE